MTVTLASIVSGYDAGLATLDHLLSRGADHCAEHGLCENETLEWKLAPDMFSFRQQAQAVCKLAAQWPARVAEIDVPPTIEGATDVAQLHEAIAQTRSFLNLFPAEQLNSRADVPFTFDLGAIAPTLPVSRWIIGFTTTNFHFHLSIAYAILRARGVPLGKPDLFAGGL